MARDYLSIGPTPCEEECEQLGADDYNETFAKYECRQFIEAIRKKLGPEPMGAQLRVTANPHDFGTYHEVHCFYDDANEEATNYAFKCESDAPCTWAEVGMTKPTKEEWRQAQ